jgi:UDPglucose 6-dehydrogenase
MTRVAMIGCGKLGKDCAEVMANHHQVIGYDIIPVDAKFRMETTIELAISTAEFIFIAAPTPHDPMYGGETPTSHLPKKDFDYSIVVDILREVNKHATSSQLVVLISTVLPGTVRKILRPLITNARFIYNPYLIAMGTVKHDMVNPEMVIIGTEDGETTGDAKNLIDFYSTFMKNDPRYVVGTWDEAEAIKIFYNTFISTKIGLVNMIQDVAEKNGNMNVDVVTKALADSTMRIMGSQYMRAGMGDGGACHPRDNIALRYLAENLDLGYDLFDGIMKAREVQAENLALKCLSKGKNITIVGMSYKPGVCYTNGSYSLLVGHYIEQHGGYVRYYDQENNLIDLHESWTQVYLLAHDDQNSRNLVFPRHCVIVDPWRRITSDEHRGEIISYGNTRTPQSISSNGQ